MRTLTDIGDVQGKRVIVRASLDVPIKDGVVQNYFRVERAIPTIQFLLERGAKVVILTHIGRDPKNSTSPLVEALKRYISVTYVDGVVGEEVQQAIEKMENGTALLLENVRAYAEEEANDAAFAARLATNGDIFVNDAFAVSHRAHASIVGISAHIPGYAGITFFEEYTELQKALSPQTPSLFILGGAKFETKAPLIEEYTLHYTHAFVGGAIANDFLKAKGYEVGESLLSPVDLSDSPLLVKENLLLPIDVVAVSGSESRQVASDEVRSDEKILDVGLGTVEMLTPYIQSAKTILWNGPMGNYEGGYDVATKALAEKIAQSEAFSIVGGGDTVAAIEALGLNESFGFLSTAGGAMLEFLEKKSLPGIDALKQ